VTDRGTGSLTDGPDIRVGHAEVQGGGSGCTAILGPFRGAVEIGGRATGTRELDALDPEHLVPRVDAVLLTGGSAFGLGAADGVMGWLEERGRGFATPGGTVPIVPAAVIYDLDEGIGRPGPSEGRAAAEAASPEPVASGARGAGTGARVGKIRGRETSSAGGVGSASRSSGNATVGALAVVNALGDVVDARGRVIAGARDEEGKFLDATRLLLERGVEGGFGETRPTNEGVGRNTTLAVVATDAPLGVLELGSVARIAATAFARRITPVHTPFDGDVVFALSTAPEEEERDPSRALNLGVAAREALERAIERAVRR